MLAEICKRFADDLAWGWSLTTGINAEKPRFFKALPQLDFLKTSATDSRPLGVEWGVVAFGAGIALYFALPLEPNIVFSASIFVVAMLLLRFLKYRSSLVYALVLTLALIAAGMTRSAWHTQSVYTPRLDDYRSAYTMTGWIEGVETSGTGHRWRLNISQVEGRDGILTEGETPEKLRVKTKTLDFVPGDGVTLRALMTGPPGPVIANGYDPAQRAYFERVGGYGFAISDPAAQQVSVTGLESLKRGLTRFRHKLTHRILSTAPQGTAGLQVALLTGERAYIPAEQVESLRVAGLAHVLAISGLHMGLVAGGVFFIFTLALAAIEPLSRRYDVRRISAVAAIVTATFYLVISTGTVSIQRAYIMAIVMFMAIILGRPAVSMRSVAVAALITLLIHPEALVSAGFQMSFAAVAALVTVYGLWRARSVPDSTPTWFGRIRGGLAGLTVTDIVAGTATGGFAAMHFHYGSRYGLIANLAAVPIFTFIVMPMGIIAVVLMPLGLEALPLMVMGRGLELMLLISDYISALPHARVLFKAAPSWAIGVYGAGFLLLCLGPWRKRLAGGVIILGVISVWSQSVQPDMRISEDADIAFWDRSNDGHILYVENRRSDSYGRSQFIERAGLADADMTEYSESLAACDVQACRIDVKGRIISVVATPEAVLEECAQSDLVLLTDRAAGPILRRRCAGKLIDMSRLVDEGAQNIYLPEDKPIRFEPANPPRRKARPWAAN